MIETILSEIQESVNNEEGDETEVSGKNALITKKIESNDSVTEDDISWDDIFSGFPSFKATKIPDSYDDIVKFIEAKKEETEKLDMGLLERIASRLESETDEEHIDYLFKILEENDFSDCFVFSHMGMESYSNGNFVVAEEAFRRAAALCEDDVLRVGYANNLAYLIRRKEIRNPQNASGKEIVELLKPGVEKKTPFH